MDKPCKECPWVTIAIAGWLGPYTPDEWIGLAHSDEIIACHQHAKGEDWDGTQCIGAANYRANISKLPRDLQAIIGEKSKSIFSTPMAFLKYHKNALGIDHE